jgi:hypothetical protein
MKPHIRQLVRITTYSSTETSKGRMAWNDAFQALKENNYQPR